MFKSRKIDIQKSSRISPRGTTSRSSKRDDGRIYVRALPDHMPGLRRVPEEYRTLDRGHSHRVRLLVILGFVFLGTVGVLYYWNNRPAPVSGSSVAFEVSGPESITSGDEVTFAIEYTNIDTIPLATVGLDVLWPEGFYYNGATENPVTGTGTTWALGPLDPGQSKKIEISGELVGAKDSNHGVQFRLSFRPSNISSEFEIEKKLSILIAEASLGVELSVPDKILAGAEAEFKAVITNTTAETLSDLDIEVVLPKDFVAVASEPQLQAGHLKGSIAQDKPLTIVVRAKAAEDASGEQSFIVEVKRRVGEEDRRLLREEKRVTPVKPEFAIELKINGQSSDFEADFGETLSYQLKVKNTSASALNDIKLTALLDSDIIDRKTVQTTGFSTNKSIVWTKEHVPDLVNLGAGMEVLISWKATLLGEASFGRATVDNLITVELEGLTSWKQTSPVFVVVVGRGLVFNQGLYWHLGGQDVGTGNLPPVTNERSEYLVIWSLDSGSQDFDAVTLSTFLPPKVSFVLSEEVDEGELNFDEETRRLEWKINNFSSKLLPLKASFYVRLVPTDEDEGTVMTVLNPATLVASGVSIFETRSYALTTAQVITTQAGDVGTVVE